MLMYNWTDAPDPAPPADAPRHTYCGRVMRPATPEDCTPKGQPPLPLKGDYAWVYCSRCRVLVAVVNF